MKRDNEPKAAPDNNTAFPEAENVLIAESESISDTSAPGAFANGENVSPSGCEAPPLPEEHKGSAIASEKVKASELAVKEMTSKGSKKRKKLGLIFLLVNILAIVIIAVAEFHNGEERLPPIEIFNTWLANYPYIILAFCCILVYLALDAVRNMLIIKASTGKFQPRTCIKVAVYGKYYDNITPLASGGQPFQVFLYSKRGINSGVATATPIITFFLYQLAFTAIAMFVFITYKGTAVPSGIRITAYVGAFFAVAIPLLIIGFSLMPKTFGRLCKAVTKLLYKMHVVKNIENALKKTDKFLKEYTDSFKIIGKYKLTLFIVLLLSVLMQISYCTIPYFVIRACNVNLEWLEVFSMCMFTYSAISFIPTPGNSFAAEGSFYLVFGALTGGFLFWGTLLWRFVSYYMILIIGIGMVIYDYFKGKRRKDG